MRRAAALAVLTAAAADDWFFGANQQWTGPAAYHINRMPDAEGVAHQNTRLRWAPNANVCGGSPPLNYTCSPTGLVAPTLPRVDACSAARGRSIVVVGDSYARHFYAGLALVLSGDFCAGALKATRVGATPCGNRPLLGRAHPSGAEQCTCARQFGEHDADSRRACRRFIRRRLGACGTTLTLVEAACPRFQSVLKAVTLQTGVPLFFASDDPQTQRQHRELRFKHRSRGLLFRKIRCRLLRFRRTPVRAGRRQGPEAPNIQRVGRLRDRAVHFKKSGYGWTRTFARRTLGPTTARPVSPPSTTRSPSVSSKHATCPPSRSSKTRAHWSRRKGPAGVA